MYRTILVPLDGSTFGEHALGLALGIAQRAGASLHLAHVHAPITAIYGGEMGGDMNLDAALRTNECNYLEEVVERLKGVTSVPITSTVLDGPTAEGLLSHSQAISANLIVMTTHGRGMVSKLWLGSVADQLVRQSTIPLLLVHPDEGTADLSAQAVPRHVLIPLDGTPFAEEIMRSALALGNLADAHYTLLRVIKPAMIVGARTAGAGGNEYARSLVHQVQKLQEELQAEAWNYLKKTAAELQARGLRVKAQVVAHEQPAAAILDYARSHAVDLVAMQTHGRRGLMQLFVGSVADKVLRGANLPLLVQRPQEAKAPRKHSAEQPAVKKPTVRHEEKQPSHDPGCCQSFGNARAD